MSEDIFYIELRRRLSTMRKGGTLYKILKEYLQPLDLWKVKPRGKAFPRGEDNPVHQSKHKFKKR